MDQLCVVQRVTMTCSKQTLGLLQDHRSCHMLTSVACIMQFVPSYWGRMSAVMNRPTHYAGLWPSYGASQSVHTPAFRCINPVGPTCNWQLQCNTLHIYISAVNMLVVIVVRNFNHSQKCLLWDTTTTEIGKDSVPYSGVTRFLPRPQTILVVSLKCSASVQGQNFNTNHDRFFSHFSFGVTSFVTTNRREQFKLSHTLTAWKQNLKTKHLQRQNPPCHTILRLPIHIRPSEYLSLKSILVLSFYLLLGIQSRRLPRTSLIKFAIHCLSLITHVCSPP
jgi:hypothetical protein